MKTVLHFIQDGDTSGIFPNLAKWHDKSRYRVLFASLNPFAPWLKEYMEAQGVECFSCDARSRKDFPFAMLKLRSYLRQQKVDILHTHLFEPSVVGLLAGALAGTPRRVATRHYSDYHTRVDKHFHVKADQLCTRLSHKVIGVSQHTTDHLVEVEKAPAEKAITIYNGIDFDRVKTSGADFAARIRREFGAEDKFLLLTVGRLHPEKGYPYLFEAAAELKNLTAKPFLWLVAGQGPFEGEFRAQVASLDCEDAVKFIGFRRDVPDLMAAADAFVLPSVAEAFGVVFTEAIYLGTPVVATKVGGIPEIVADGADGVLVPPADSRALARAIAELINDPEKLAALGGGGEKIAEKFEFVEMVRRYEAVYESLFADR